MGKIINSLFPSSVNHIPNHFEEPVFTCYEAACSRNIYLWEELKSLVFYSKEGFYVVHIPGDRLVNIKKLKKIGVKGGFCNTIVLEKHGLRKGCINPFNVYECLNPLRATYICNKVFATPRVYTNDGTLTGSISFPPSLLLTLYRSMQRVDISVEWNKLGFSRIRA